MGLDRDVFLMRDRQTGTIWSHLTGTASEGALAGSRLAPVPLPLMTWREWKRLHPSTMVLSPETQFSGYYRLVRLGAFNTQEATFGDSRLPSNALVVGVEVGGAFMGYPLETLRRASGVVNSTLAGEPIVVLFSPSAQTGLAFSRRVDGSTLEFYNAVTDGFELRDRATGTLWSVEGRALDGSLAGSSLAFVPSFITEWYGWSAYHPATGLYQAPEAPTAP